MQADESMTEIPLPEFLEWYSVRESLAADTNSLEDTVAPQLVQDQNRIDLPSSLLVVWNDTSHEVRVRVPQRALLKFTKKCHEIHQNVSFPY